MRYWVCCVLPLIAVLFTLSLCAGWAAESGAAPGTVTIVFTDDTRGLLEPCG